MQGFQRRRGNCTLPNCLFRLLDSCLDTEDSSQTTRQPALHTQTRFSNCVLFRQWLGTELEHGEVSPDLTLELCGCTTGFAGLRLYQGKYRESGDQA